jgi:hypothetical protein
VTALAQHRERHFLCVSRSAKLAAFMVRAMRSTAIAASQLTTLCMISQVFWTRARQLVIERGTVSHVRIVKSWSRAELSRGSSGTE